MKTKTLPIFAAIVALIAWLPVTQFYWDMQVRRLCAIDGGVKVYETVELSADQFDARGKVRIRGDKVLAGSGYTLQFSRHYYKESNVPVGNSLSFEQARTALIRNSDGKLFGESLIYERAGGGILDLISDAPSHFECPAIPDADEYAIAKRVFVPLTEPGQAVHAFP